jgi:2-polyprenyl-6-methoxyphenol hydroxylase-like FAD-dependent oxidoreductase
MKTETARHAIVIGASMGGLLAARVLADHYQQVTLLERDIFPVPGENRQGVPQGRHAHALLLKGREVIEQFFPGIIEELQAQGALASRVEESCFFFNGGYFPKVYDDKTGLLISRPLLEAQVRQRLLALSGTEGLNVKIIENCQVLDLVTNTEHNRITGVKLIQRHGTDTEEILNADLVVDATGRNSKSPTWLANLGYQQPEVDEVNVDISYTTRIYRRLPEHLQGNTAMVVSASPPDWRGGVILAQESSRWIVSVGGYLGDRAPMKDAGFLEFVKSLPAPDIYNTIKDAEPLSEFIPYKFSGSLRRRYEKLSQFPAGYLVFGDAICSFNPIYGQGMTVAALEAIALQNCLQQGTDKLARRFFSAASKVVDVPWNITVGSDLRIPQVQGKRSLMGNLLNWYVSKLQTVAQQDPVLAIAFLSVTNLLIAPTSLMRPGIIFRVLLSNLWHRHHSPAIGEQLSSVS